ncbi:hypothetical protein DICPUDRAFT_20077, partial [Dictyostelium purpureum]
KKQLYFIRPDVRKCSSPHCGGYFLKKINVQEGAPVSELEEIYISEVMVSDPLINSTLLTDQKQYQIDHPNSIIVSGEIAPDHHDGQYHCLHLTDIYHKLQLPIEANKGPRPLVVPLESYYFLKPSPLVCNHLASNCPSVVILKANTQETKFISSYSEPYTKSVPFLDQKWFTSRLLSQDPTYNALAKGYILKDKLIISSVFSNTADPRTPCAKMVDATKCNIAIGQVPTFNRDQDRCPVFNKCVQRGPCHLGIPSCPEGYRLFSLPSGSKGCPKYYCDADVLPNP